MGTTYAFLKARQNSVLTGIKFNLQRPEFPKFKFQVLSLDKIGRVVEPQISKLLDDVFHGANMLVLCSARATLMLVVRNENNQIVAVSALQWLPARVLDFPNKANLLGFFELNNGAIQADYRRKGLGTEMVKIRLEVMLPLMIQTATNFIHAGKDLKVANDPEWVTSELLLEGLQVDNILVRSNLTNKNWFAGFRAATTAASIPGFVMAENSTMRQLKSVEMGELISVEGNFQGDEKVGLIFDHNSTRWVAETATYSTDAQMIAVIGGDRAVQIQTWINWAAAASGTTPDPETYPGVQVWRVNVPAERALQLFSVEGQMHDLRNMEFEPAEAEMQRLLDENYAEWSGSEGPHIIACPVVETRYWTTGLKAV